MSEIRELLVKAERVEVLTVLFRNDLYALVHGAEAQPRSERPGK
jgi:hypothetical protein